MHRAMYILNPTTELSGEYKCFVSTFYDEDFMIKKMIVFSPEKKLEMVHQKTDVQGVNVSCSAYGIYPEPKITLVKDNNRINSQSPLQGVTVVTSSRSGQYDISASVILREEDLSTESPLYCELRIPHTSYTKRKKLEYYSKLESDSASRICISVTLIVLQILNLICTIC
uniref:Ig-like domain-containing protein n=1 Tax=Clastoptera arizonana TaxID=38151 RepID=A0A1B6EFC0_9HEMI